MLILGHMDVVEAKREDWKFDPFVFREQDGYFLGRGTSDMKNGDVATTMAAVKLISRRVQAEPRHHLLLQRRRGDEGRGRDARLDQVAQPDRRRVRPQRRRRLRVLRRQFQAARLRHLDRREDVPDLFLHDPQSGRAQQPAAAGQCDLRSCRCAREAAHLSLPADAERRQSRLFRSNARGQEGNSALGNAIRAWLANPNDGAAADVVEASPLDVGLTRTRCVATMLKGGHADNALPQSATRDGQLPDHAGRAAEGRPGRAAGSWPGPRSR